MDNSNNPNSTSPDPSATAIPSTQPVPQDSSLPISDSTIPTPQTQPWTPAPINSEPSTYTPTATLDSAQLNPTPVSATSSLPSDPNLSSMQTSSQMSSDISTQSFTQPTTSAVNSDPMISQSTPASPLDHPWSMPQNTINPSETITIPLTFNPPPASTPDIVPQSPPALQSTVETPQVAPTPISTTDTASAPTDLSHLLSNNSPMANSNNINSAETLVVPPQATPTTPDVSTTSGIEHKSMPKWLIGVAAGLLIIVVGASAYFILGIGQPSKETSSLPAEVSTATVKTPPPIASPAAQQSEPETATSSASFGQLQGSNTTAQASSAADIIKQRGISR